MKKYFKIFCFKHMRFGKKTKPRRLACPDCFGEVNDYLTLKHNITLTNIFLT